MVTVTREIPNATLYDSAVIGMECGSLSSHVLVGGSWERAWRAADAARAVDEDSARGCFAAVRIADRYAIEEDGVPEEEAPSAYLTDEALARGFAVLHEKYPRLAAELADGNGDAISGDAFLQCVVHGDVVYG